MESFSAIKLTHYSKLLYVRGVFVLHVWAVNVSERGAKTNIKAVVLASYKIGHFKHLLYYFFVLQPGVHYEQEAANII